jgi:hypothetical protein
VLVRQEGGGTAAAVVGVCAAAEGGQLVM